MADTVYEYLAADHDRLEGLLDRSSSNPGEIDLQPYHEFRKGPLRHISIEEKILLPAISRLQRGISSADAERIRLDHGALAALLVPPPDERIIRTIRRILDGHNVLEEKLDGIYRELERLAGPEAREILEKMKAAPEVPVMPFNERPEVLDATRRALTRAGYELG
jgi:hypothetical protein